MSEALEGTIVDTLIVGAGLSGIGSAVHLRQGLPDASVLILEARERIGGTWDLFRYPGVRSDSDMHTLGYAFKPWTGAKAIADGPSILRYIQETAQEQGVLPLIRFGHRVLQADWDSASALWTLQVLRLADGQTQRLQCRFLLMCSGYYNYEHGHAPHFEGQENFAGPIVHPQHWRAARVTLVQRSPTYVVDRPSTDAVGDALRRTLPPTAAYALTRWKNVLMGMFFYALARRKPALATRRLLDGVAQALPADYPVTQHFTPRYKPWAQRICLVPDGDLFAALREGKARMVTDTIDRFEAGGIRMRSGAFLPADVVISATGLDLLGFGGMQIAVDGQALEVSQALSYKGMMLQGVPNFAYVFGYTNASWTLKSDLTGQYVVRLLRYMRRKGLATVVPVLQDQFRKRV
ncbi:MAG: NAD(P)/FAD-dependent oxidoreductase [Betaproteobacteria bacterium]|nr:NAD(P)/FAD-dependent oxidoreductase [Betaproteobacteria bacterium]